MRWTMRSGVRFFDAPLGQGVFLVHDPGAASAGADLPPANFLRCPSGTRGGRAFLPDQAGERLLQFAARVIGVRAANGFKKFGLQFGRILVRLRCHDSETKLKTKLMEKADEFGINLGDAPAFDGVSFWHLDTKRVWRHKF